MKWFETLKKKNMENKLNLNVYDVLALGFF